MRCYLFLKKGIVVDEKETFTMESHSNKCELVNLFGQYVYVWNGKIMAVVTIQSNYVFCMT